MTVDLPYLALVEGLGLALSPCILPVLPFIVASSAERGPARPFYIILGFVISFTTFALLSRALIAQLHVGQSVVQHVAYGLLLVFGLVMLVPKLSAAFSNLTSALADKANRASDNTGQDGLLGGLWVGTLIGVVWVPCAGPILAAALIQVIQADTNLHAAITVLFFSLGAAVPMLAIALFSQRLFNHLRVLNRHAETVRRLMGVLILIFAGLGLANINVGAWWIDKFEGAKTERQASMQDVEPEFKAYPAPEIAGIERWYNTDPLTIESLKGKVVLVDFWTYSCINCLRTLPYIKDWYAKYKDKGFVVIGVHAPEFPFEAEADNVAAAVKRLGITYPVALDNKFTTWRNFQNQYWPAHYLIDREGRVVYTHFGEGRYSITEAKIRDVLGLTGAAEVKADRLPFTMNQTHETYLGFARAANFAGDGGLKHDRSTAYQFPATLPMHNWALQGEWKVDGDHITAAKAGAALRLNFVAGKVYLVLGSTTGKPVHTRVSIITPTGLTNKSPDAQDGALMVTDHRLYQLIDLDDAQSATLEIAAEDEGLEAYAFTFGF